VTHDIYKVGVQPPKLDDFREVDWNDLDAVSDFAGRLQVAGLWSSNMAQRVVKTACAIHPLEDVLVAVGGEIGA
jgi:hypothetical protein